MGLSDKSEEAPLHILVDNLVHAVNWQSACAGHTRNLKVGGCRREVWIEAARRRRDEIDRDGHRRILRLQFFGVFSDTVEQGFCGRARIGAP